MANLIDICGDSTLVNLLGRRAEGSLRLRQIPARASNGLDHEERADAVIVDLRSLQGRAAASPRVRNTLASRLPAVFVVGNDPGTWRQLRNFRGSAHVDFVRMTEDAAEPADEILERIERLIVQAREEKTAPAPPGMTALRHIAPSLHAPDTGRLDARRVAHLLGVPQAKLAQLMGKRPGTVAKTPDGPALQQALRVFERIAAPLLHLAGSPERLRAWLNAPNPALGGETPLQLVLEGHAEAVAGLVERIAVGEPA
jgi:hypothetical protein